VFLGEFFSSSEQYLSCLFSFGGALITEYRHVIDNGLKIEVNVLCQTIDLLCGSIILVLKGSNLHNINLPRSWLNILLHKNRPNSDGTMALDISETVVKIFVVTLGRLACNLHLGKQEIGGTLYNIAPNSLISFLIPEI